MLIYVFMASREGRSPMTRRLGVLVEIMVCDSRVGDRFWIPSLVATLLALKACYSRLGNVRRYEPIVVTDSGADTGLLI